MADRGPFKQKGLESLKVSHVLRQVESFLVSGGETIRTQDKRRVLLVVPRTHYS